MIDFDDLPIVAPPPRGGPAPVVAAPVDPGGGGPREPRSVRWCACGKVLPFAWCHGRVPNAPTHFALPPVKR